VVFQNACSPAVPAASHAVVMQLSMSPTLASQANVTHLVLLREAQVPLTAYFENTIRANAHWPSRGSPVAKTHRLRTPAPTGIATFASRRVCPFASTALSSGKLASSGPVQESA
jgi:hypothetical protein